MSRVGLEPHAVDHARRHRHGRDACRADQGIDLAAAPPAHDFAHEHAGRGAHAEGERPEREDSERLQTQELIGAELRADRKAQEDRDHVDELVCAALLKRSTTPASRSRLPNMSMPISGAASGRNSMTTMGTSARTESPRGAIRAERCIRCRALLGGQQPHDRRLDDRHERHVEYAGDGDGAEQFGASRLVRKMAVGPSAPPMMPMDEASARLKSKPGTAKSANAPIA